MARVDFRLDLRVEKTHAQLVGGAKQEYDERHGDPFFSRVVVTGLKFCVTNDAR